MYESPTVKWVKSADTMELPVDVVPVVVERLLPDADELLVSKATEDDEEVNPDPAGAVPRLVCEPFEDEPFPPQAPMDIRRKEISNPAPALAISRTESPIFAPQ